MYLNSASETTLDFYIDGKTNGSLGSQNNVAMY